MKRVHKKTSYPEFDTVKNNGNKYKIKASLDLYQTFLYQSLDFQLLIYDYDKINSLSL